MKQLVGGFFTAVTAFLLWMSVTGSTWQQVIVIGIAAIVMAVTSILVWTMWDVDPSPEEDD